MSELPKGWAATTIGEVVTPSVRPRRNPSEHPDLPFIGMEHIEANSMKLLGTIPSGKMKSAAVHFVPGDVLYGRLRPYLNKVFRPDFEGLCSAEFIALPPSEAIDSRFLQYILNSAPFVSFASHQDEGDRPRVDFDQLKSFPVQLPPRQEQERIVAEIEKNLTRLDAGVEALRRLQSKLRRYRASVLKAACEGRLVPTEAELARKEGRSYEPADQLLVRILKERRARWEADQLARMKAAGKTPKDDRWKARYVEPEPPSTVNLPELPEGWAWTTLGQVFRVSVGATPSRSQPSYWAGDIPWVSSGEVAFCRIRVTRECITQDGLDNTSTEIHPPGTVLLGMIGEGKTRGQVAILDTAACNNQNSAAIRVSEAGLPPEYVYRFLEGEYERTRRIGSGNNQPALNKSKVEAMLIPLPPLNEQLRIVVELERRLSALDYMGRNLIANGRRGTRLRQAILRLAFEGRLVQQNPTDEAATALLERIRAESEAATDGSSKKIAKSRRPKTRRRQERTNPTP